MYNFIFGVCFNVQMVEVYCTIIYHVDVNLIPFFLCIGLFLSLNKLNVTTFHGFLSTNDYSFNCCLL